MTVLGAHLSLHWREPVAVLTVRPGPMFHEYFRLFAGRILTMRVLLHLRVTHIPAFNRSLGEGSTTSPSVALIILKLTG